MAFNPTAESAEFHYLVEMYLDATTIRLADQDLSILSGSQTGFFYEGRLSEVATVKRSLGSLLETKESYDNFTINIDNRDDFLSQIVNIETTPATFANKSACVFIGQGLTKTNYATLFPGRVLFPGGFRYDEDDIEIVLVDRRISDRRILPDSDKTFNVNDFPDVETKSKNKVIPIVYGSWQSTAGAENVRLPAFGIDVDGTTKEFKIANHRIHKLEKVFKNAQELTIGLEVDNISLDDATFQIVLGGYDSTNDIVSVNCLGMPSGINENGTMISDPGTTLKHMLTAQIGLTATNLNLSAFDTFHDTTITEGPNNVRRYINTRISTETLISELLLEVGADLRLDAQGRYEPKFRNLDIEDDRIKVNDSDIILENPRTEKADFRVEFDPDRIFANKITGNYLFNPENSLFIRTYTASADSQDSDAIDTTVERQINFNWVFQAGEIETRVDRELDLYGDDEPLSINVQLSPRFLRKQLADQVDITFDTFQEKTFQIRGLSINLNTMTNKIRGFEAIPINFGLWTNDAAPDWDVATEAQKKVSGFWTTDTGFATSTDANSQNKSRWF
jgi:hypothetical protein